ncbi:MAG: hypothetical protein M0R68_07490 [Bacteroidetes bacterium]|nr:hypothetical protein [Bacteroidota bacterium]
MATFASYLSKLPQTIIEIRKRVIVDSIAFSLIANMSEVANNTEWKKRMVQILSLDPINRKRVLKILLDHADECGMSDDSQGMLRECGDDLKAAMYLKRLKKYLSSNLQKNRFLGYLYVMECASIAKNASKVN